MNNIVFLLVFKSEGAIAEPEFPLTLLKKKPHFKANIFTQRGPAFTLGGFLLAKIKAL